jgi:hypothetical protein
MEQREPRQFQHYDGILADHASLMLSAIRRATVIAIALCSAVLPTTASSVVKVMPLFLTL